MVSNGIQFTPHELKQRFYSCSGNREIIQQIIDELESRSALTEYKVVKTEIFEQLSKITGISIGEELPYDDEMIAVNIDYIEGIVTSVEKSSLSLEREPTYWDDYISAEVLAKFSLWDEIILGVAPQTSQDDSFFTVGRNIGNLIVTEVNRKERTFMAIGSKGKVREYDMDDFISIVTPDGTSLQKNQNAVERTISSNPQDNVQAIRENIGAENNRKTTKEPSLSTELNDNEDLIGNINISNELFPTISIASIRACGNIPGLPNKPIYDLKEEVKLNISEFASIASVYEQGLQAYIKELRQVKKGTRFVSLENGNLISGITEDYIYQFPFDFEKDSELFDGARIRAIIDGKDVDGHIHAVIERFIVISLEKDCGPNIESCLLKVDNTAMLEALREKIGKIASGEATAFNTRLAENVINNHGEEELAATIDKSILCGTMSGNLNELQFQAVAKALANEVSYIWGPPGTGKTSSLTVLLEMLYNEKKKVLLCSNTNRAVDQVLLKICNSYGRNHQALIDGDIMRIGQISHDELKEWADLVSLDGIVATKSIALKVDKENLEAEISCIENETSLALKILKQFKNADLIADSIKQHNQRIKELSSNIEKLKVDKERWDKRKKSLVEEKTKAASANRVLRVFLRSKEEIEPDVINAETALGKVIKEIFQFKIEEENLHNKLQNLTEEYDEIIGKLSSYKREDIEQQLKEADAKKQPLLNKLSEILKQIEDIASAAVKSARIVGATVTKAYLSPKLFDGFDVVVVDEASMVLLPALFYVAGLAREKVVISGDPKQLSPIVQTEQKEIFNAIGKDVFFSAKIEPNSARVVMLTEQYRMLENICQLISPTMYGGSLVTSSTIEKSSNMIDDTLHGELIIIDTSTLAPFSNKDAYNSKYNLMNAITIRNYCLDLMKQGKITDVSCCGICTPYSAQSKLLQKMLMGAELNMIQAGTVHSYQGDAKQVLIIDIPDSEPHKTAGMFLVADNAEDSGAKLFNVAISRTQYQLIIVANLEYLDKKLPAYAFLRDYLARMSKYGKVVDARDVIALYPIVHDLKKYGEPFNLSKETLKTGLFSEKDFSLVCREDMKRAKNRIDIFSGFVTSQRISVYESIIREKTNNGVVVRCVTRPPRTNGSITKEEGKIALNALETWGCIVDTRASIHEKAVIIDDEIVWFGSLNPLSHTTKTNEMMARVESTEIASQILNFLSINKKRREQGSSEGENPRCPECRSRTSYCTGQYGGFWRCEECDWTQNATQKMRSILMVSSLSNDNAPKCPLCGSKTITKNSRFGEFFGCSKYPECPGVVRPKKAKGKAGAGKMGSDKKRKAVEK